MVQNWMKLVTNFYDISCLILVSLQKESILFRRDLSFIGYFYFIRDIYLIETMLE